MDFTSCSRDAFEPPMAAGGCGPTRGSVHASPAVPDYVMAIDAESGVPVEVAAGKNLLEGLEEAAQETVAVGCRNGGCGVCRIRILSGTFTKRKMSRKYVSADQERDRIALACRVYPTSAIVYKREPLTN